jgi:hypothetical protein
VTTSATTYTTPRDTIRGTLERIGKANFMWCLDESDMAKAKADLAEQGLVAMV